MSYFYIAGIKWNLTHSYWLLDGCVAMAKSKYCLAGNN